MRFSKKDALFVVPLGAILLVLLLRAGSEKARPLPADSRHSQSLAQIVAGQSRADVEKGCLDCHNQRVRPLSKAHPPKEQCLICHKK